MGTEDDLVPASSSISLNDVISSADKTLLKFPVGHVEICVSLNAYKKLWPQVIEWLVRRSM